MQHQQYYQQFLETTLYPRELKSYELSAQGESAIYLYRDDKKFINFSSNDYLGLSKHPLLIARSQEYTKKFGAGATSSRLVTGNFHLYDPLEKKLSALVGKPCALILGTGYQTNSSVLEALFDSHVLGCKPLVFCDRLCHTSMLMATQHAAHIKRFQHNNLTHLKQLLEKYRNTHYPKFILVESIYSMEGDQTDFKNLIQLARKYQTFLYVDDAHAIGVLGATGNGLAAEYSEDIDLVMGTFSKAGGSFGGYIACSATIRQYLINKCRGLIYSTGLPPAILGAIDAALELFPQLERERQQLFRYAAQLRIFFQQQKLNCGNTNTHIVPWIMGDAKQTLHAGHLLEEEGILGTAIRPPSVPTGKSRIRFCLSAAHSEEDIAQLIRAIAITCKKL